MSSNSDNAETIKAPRDGVNPTTASYVSRVVRLSRLFNRIAGSKLLGVVVALILTYVLWNVMGDVVLDYEDLPGTDTYWHTTLIDEAADRVLDGNPVGPIAETINGGYPYLYGTDTVYPQFAYWVGTGIALVVESASLSFAILILAALLVSQLTFSLDSKRGLA